MRFLFLQGLEIPDNLQDLSFAKMSSLASVKI